ncbi:MAG: trypsin-like serine protease [Myxococcales bacterium]|nr:trypsin-like serine protease [Myxococcales bacterium]
MRISPLLATALVAASCQAGDFSRDDDSSIGSATNSIVGGVEATFDEAVVAVVVGGLCTGTLVAPRIVLTAAHCVRDVIEAGFTNLGRVNFGDGRGPWIDSIDVIDMTMHRLYDPPAFFLHDIALLRLARAAPESIKPIPISTTALTDEDVGLQLRVVGFGNTDGANGGSGSGTKRQVTVPLLEVNAAHIGFGDHIYNTCQGDSGGPTFATFDGVEYVIGVTSFGASGCAGRSYMTRTDVMWDVFLTEVIGAWSGPCQNDGECVEDASCLFPDPDCDICGMEGLCGTDCAAPDRDCPLGGLPSDDCSQPTDCESRLCTGAPEDSRITYCSMSCDPTKLSSQSGCSPPLTVCEEQPDGTGICGFSGISPGAQGSSCAEGNECRSGMCDGREGICVEPCGGDLPECGEEYECRAAGDVKVCAIPDERGCSTGSGRSGLGSGLLLLMGLAWAGRRRQRN